MTDVIEIPEGAIVDTAPVISQLDDVDISDAPKIVSIKKMMPSKRIRMLRVAKKIEEMKDNVSFESVDDISADQLDSLADMIEVAESLCVKMAKKPDEMQEYLASHEKSTEAVFAVFTKILNDLGNL